MNATYTVDPDPFAATFPDALAANRTGVEAPTAVDPSTHAWAAAPVTAMAPVAEALRAAGFGQAALEVARLAGDARVEEWSAIATADAALASVIATHGIVAVPSVQVRADGSPRFVVCGDDADVLRAHFEDEHGERGVDAELRLFLDEALRPGDRFLDACPGAGFAALTAATRDGVDVVVLVEDDVAGDALRRSAQASGCAEVVTVQLVDNGVPGPGAHEGRTVLHAGRACDVPGLLQDMRARCGTIPVDVVAWRCGAAHDADYDAEAMQVAAAVLGVLGFRHFALAVGEEGVELVPAEAMASNTMIFSLGEAFLARVGG